MTPKKPTPTADTHARICTTSIMVAGIAETLVISDAPIVLGGDSSLTIRGPVGDGVEPAILEGGHPSTQYALLHFLVRGPKPARGRLLGEGSLRAGGSCIARGR